MHRRLIQYLQFNIICPIPMYQDSEYSENDLRLCIGSRAMLMYSHFIRYFISLRFSH